MLYLNPGWGVTQAFVACPNLTSMLRAGAVTFWQIVIFPINIFAVGARPFHPLAASSTPKDQIYPPNLTIILLTPLLLTKEAAILVIFLAPLSVICGLTKCQVDENT
jgi:hypothetical protein